MRKPLFSLALIFSLSAAFSQQSVLDYHPSADILVAENLYLTEAYAGSAYDFTEFIHSPNKNQQRNEKAQFYAVLTSLQTGDKFGEKKLKRFQVEYPNSIYLENSDWILGNYYLVQGDLDKAYGYYNSINANKLSDRKRTDYQFRMGYLQFNKGKLDIALNNLEPLMLSDKYQSAAHYYVGHIYYQKGELDRALLTFDELVSLDESYADKVKPYLMQIAFNQNKYSEAIAMGKELLAENRSKFIQSEASKVVGESLFKLESYEEAIPYLKAYEGEMEAVDYYQLGFANYQAKRYQEAISYFNKITSGTTALAQTAYLQLGNSYLKQGQKREALSAYKSASEMSFDKEIQENAFYQYAILSYDIGNPYHPTASVLMRYNKKYPKNKHIEEVNTWLVETLLSSNDFEGALEVLNDIHQKSPELKLAYNKASFLYGIDLFGKSNYNQAISFFKQVRFDSNPALQAQNNFWLGESYYQSGKYNLAANSYLKAKDIKVDFPQSDIINYSIAYAYFKQEKFDKAKQYFELYRTNENAKHYIDASMRLADSELALQNTETALSLYEEILSDDTNHAEAAYNRAVVIGITGSSTQKISALEQFLQDFPESIYSENAQLELADAYMRESNMVRANEQLNDLIRNGSKANAGRARLKKGLLFYNQSKNLEALEQYEIVAKDYKTSILGQDAVDLAKRIYVEEGRIAEFETWSTDLGYSYDAEELQNLMYLELQTLFDKSAYTEVIQRAQNFINRYPNSNYALYVQYWMGESLYQASQQDLAIQPLTKVASITGDLQEEALLRLSQIYLDENNSTEALLSLEALNKITSNNSYIFYAQMHLMRLYSERGLDKKALDMANRIKTNDLAKDNDLIEVDWVSARSYVSAKQWKKAKSAYENLEKVNNPSIKAEALYYKAYFLNKEKSYEASNEVIFDLASNYSSQQLWGSKALVVMAKNYYALNDPYQATFTLEQVIENYKEYPDVLKEANKLLKQYKKK